jgi:hypothetical protein
MPRKVEGKCREAASGQPGRKTVPSIEVFANTMHKHDPTFACAGPLAAKDERGRARKLDRDGAGGAFRRPLISHGRKCRSRC